MLLSRRQETGIQPLLFQDRLDKEKTTDRKLENDTGKKEKGKLSHRPNVEGIVKIGCSYRGQKGLKKHQNEKEGGC